MSFCNLEGATLNNAQCTMTNFVEANLKSADITGACLEGVTLDKTDLRGAKFDNPEYVASSSEDSKR